MVYKEYLEAAKRHRETCEFLISKLNDRTDFIDVRRQEKLIHNIYYLSGYIIECIISYTFFNVIEYDKNRSVYDLEYHNNFGYTFHSYFKEHSVKANEKRIDVIRLRGGTLPTKIPIVGNVAINEEEKKMYETWDAKVRYTKTHLEFNLNINNVSSFFNLASSVYVNMKNI